MFTRLSRLHPNLQILVVSIGCILLWTNGFLNPLLPLKGSELSPLYDWAFGWAFSSALLSTLTAFVLTGSTVVLWHYILVEEGLLPRNNMIPALVTMLLLTYIPEMMRLSPVLPANLLLILSIRSMMKMPHHDQAYQEIFSAGLLLSLAALFNPYHVLFIPLLWFALILFRTGSFREWIISLLGVCAPVFYALFFIFWNNQIMETLAAYRNFFFSFRLFKGFVISPFMVYLILGLMGILFLPAFARFMGRMNEKLIALRKFSALMIWLFLLGAVSLPVIQTDWLIKGSVLLLSVSMILSSYLISVKKKRVPEILLFLLVAAIITGKFLL